MCGIVAVYGSPDRASFLSARRDQLLSRLLHRGPDGHRIWSYRDGNVHFGHARLSVIDLEMGWQPLIDESSRTSIIFNGEIYNFKKLRTELVTLGHLFSTKSDTEVLLKSYLQWGKDCLKRIEGIFAFCIFDARSNSLFFARDPFGVKPLYYEIEGSTISVCSELRPLAILTKKSPKLNRAAAIQYLTMGYSIAPDTIIDGIVQLQAGECATWNGELLKREIYFSLENNCNLGPKKPESLIQEEFDHLFSSAVRSQLVADIPVGVALSGGIDSSLLSAVAIKESQSSVKCFTVDFSLAEYSELEEAKKVANQIGADHVSSSLGLDLSLTAIKDSAWRSDAPIFDNSFLPTSQLFKNVKPHVSVLLSGDGGDELFLGYETYKADHLAARMSKVPSVARKAMKKVGSLIEPSLGKVTTSYKAKRFLAELNSDLVLSHFGWRNLLDPFSYSELQAHDSKSIWETHDPKILIRRLHESIPREIDFLTRMSLLDIKTWLANDILVKVDRASMSEGVEARVPFLDLGLAKFALSLSDREKFSLRETKLPLRRELRKRVPGYQSGKKKGFVFPAGEWLQGAFRQDLDAIINLRSPLMEFIDSNTLFEYVKRHQRGNANYTHFLWAIVTFNFWWDSLLGERHRIQSN